LVDGSTVAPAKVVDGQPKIKKMLTGQSKKAHCWLTRQAKYYFLFDSSTFRSCFWLIHQPIINQPSTNHQPTSSWLTSQPSVDVFWLTRQPKTTEIG